MKTLGIDLGTTNSVVGAVTGTEPEIVPINGNRKTPSVVSFDDIRDGEGAVMVGDTAVQDQRMVPEHVVSGVKRHMGEDPDSEDAFSFEYGDHEYNPQMISSYILRKLAAGARDYLGSDIDNAVVTVPADFSKNEREATKVAGAYAGLEIDTMIPEPTAACMAYGISQTDEEFETVAVYDLGGGTFDITIVNIDYGTETDGESRQYYDVQATDGRQQLGGEDIDEMLTEYVIEQFEEETGIDVSDDKEATRRVQDAAKKTKEQLSEKSSESVRVPKLAKGENLDMEIDQETFNDIISDLVETTIEVSDDLLEKEGLTPADIDTVLLVGGSTHIPLVRERVREFFGTEPSKEVNPDEAVAMGAAIEAARLEEKRRLPDEESPSTELPNDIGRGEVAADALGVRVVNFEGDERRDRVVTLIENDEDLPATTVKDGFTTANDGDTEVVVQIYEGEAEYIDEEDATPVDEFTLKDLPSVPSDEIDIEIEFELDRNNMLNATAEELNHGITGSTDTDEIGGEESTDDDDFIVETEFLETRSTVESRREWMPPVKLGDRVV